MPDAMAQTMDRPAVAVAEAGGGAAFTLGPILRFRGSGDGGIRISVTVAGAEAPPPGFKAIGTLAGTRFDGIDLTLPSPPGAKDAALPEALVAAVPDLPARVAVPSADGPLRIAFASCNGAEDEAAAAATPGGRNAMWAHLARHHAAEPFHLLVMGGDQIYADSLWDLPTIREWRRLSAKAGYEAPFTDAMRQELEAHYLSIYTDVFGSPEVAGMLASVPSLMIWDDHDIVDGYGSRKPHWQASPVAKGLFAAARRAFALVQLGVAPDRPAEARVADGFAADDAIGFGWSGDLGCARIAVPDLRSERTRHSVLPREGVDHLARATGEAEAPHRVVVFSVPLLNADLSPLERVLTPLMPLIDLYQDDLRDQWMSFAHREQWDAVTGHLLDVSREARVTLLSGEIHLGAHGVARRGSDSVEQFIASGIAHPPPPAKLARGYEFFADRTKARGDVALEMRTVAPDGRRYVAERNWLAVTLHPDGTRDAVLHAEVSGPLPLDAPRP
ncbi:MAG: alkaline phosphatase D family protein [Pseudomonadota bacterium]